MPSSIRMRHTVLLTSHLRHRVASSLVLPVPRHETGSSAGHGHLTLREAHAATMAAA